MFSVIFALVDTILDFVHYLSLLQPERCGSEIGLRLSADLPGLEFGEECNATACGSFSVRETKIEKCILKQYISVKNCGDYYIYNLPGFEEDWCDVSYCTMCKFYIQTFNVFSY